jgi:hypothetical protein
MLKRFQLVRSLSLEHTQLAAVKMEKKPAAPDAVVTVTVPAFEDPGIESRQSECLQL